MNKKTNVVMIGVLILIVVILGSIILGYYKKETLNIPNPIVTMEVENYGTIKIELYPDMAPEAVKNFITLANNKFYDGLTFHRVVKDFMIQGGDKEGTGAGSVTFADLYDNEDESVEYKYVNKEKAKAKDSYSIKGEFIANGYEKNTLSLEEGTIAMARNDYTSYSSTLASESYDSAGSQFFIMTNNEHTNLTGYYAGFGKVIEGIDVVHAIENVECTTATKEGEEEQENEANKEVSTPVEKITISTVTVETNGVKYEKPETLQPFNYMKWLYNLYGLTYTE